MLKPLTIWNTTNCGKFLKRQKNQTTLSVSWETCMEVKKQQLELDMDWFKIGKEVHQCCILSPCFLNFYAVHIMKNAGLEELQAGIKMTRRSINNLKCGDDTSLMKESKEELKSLLMRVKEEGGKAGLKPSIQKRRSWHPVPSIHGE